MKTEIIIAIISLVASSGFWGFLLYKAQRRDKQKDKESDDTRAIKTALKGLLHQDIISEGDKYIHRGHITVKELEDFKTYLYDPYKALGGDGMADEIYEALVELLHTQEDTE